MLNLIFSRYKAKGGVKVHVDSRTFFSLNKKAEWFQDPFVQEILQTVDGATVVDGLVLKSSDGDVIPPEYLSTGAKTAICVYEFPDHVFNATQMGDNALYFAMLTAMNKNITLLTYHVLPHMWLMALDVQKDYNDIDMNTWSVTDFYILFKKWLEEGRSDD